MKVFRSHLLLCGGTGCQASGSSEVKKALLTELDKNKLTEEIKVVETGCNGFCAMGPHSGRISGRGHLHESEG